MTTTVAIANVAGAETITGPWIFSGTTTLPTRTRRIFVPASVMVQINGTAMSLTTLGTYPDAWSEWPLVTGPGAAPQALGIPFLTPQDYDSGGTFRVVYSQSSTTVTQWRAEINYNELANAQDPTGAATVVATSLTPDGVVNQVQIDTIGTVAAPLTAGTWMRMAFERDSAHADDVNGDTILLIGVIFEYTARVSN